MSKKIAVISKSELSKLHVGTLMSRRDALLKCEEAFELSDQFGCKVVDIQTLKVIISISYLEFFNQ